MSTLAPAVAPRPVSGVKPAVSRIRLRWMTLALVFVLGIFVARFDTTLASMGMKAPFIEPIQDVYRLLLANNVEAPDADKLQKGAIDGMLESLDDPYAEYIPVNDAQDFDKQMTGHFVGIGCQVEVKDGWLTVVSPIEDSPAYAAGIMAGDRITKIEDSLTHGLTVDACIKLLTGEPKTPVNITVLRDGKDIPFTIVRERIVSKSVRGYRRLPDGSGHWDYVLDPAQRLVYIRLSQFTPTSPEELLEALQEAQVQLSNAPAPADHSESGSNIGGLILDLRNNPGGFMEAALEIADLFIKDGVLLSVRGRNAPEQVFRAHTEGTLPEFPLAVMVNGSSASASEIVSGALADHHRATIIGTRSYGKGLVQTVLPLPHSPKAQVKFTTQRYYLPSGRLIQRMDGSTEWGVDPSPGFFVPMSEKETVDWILHRRDQDILRKEASAQALAEAGQEHWPDPNWIETNAKDKQLAAAVRAIDNREVSGQWVALSDVGQEHGKITDAELRSLERVRERMGREFARIEKRIDALEKATDSGKAAVEPKDLWPDTLDLTDGRVEVFDKEGKEIARLKITGRDLERWLVNADVSTEKTTEDGTPVSSAPAPAMEGSTTVPAAPVPATKPGGTVTPTPVTPAAPVAPNKSTSPEDHGK